MLRTLVVMASALALSSGGCDNTNVDPHDPCASTYAILGSLRIDQVRFPTPVLSGSRFEVTGESFIPDQSCVVPHLVLSGQVRGFQRETLLPGEVTSENSATATLSAEALAALGAAGPFNGVFEVRFVAVDGTGAFSVASPVSFEMVASIVPEAYAVEQSEAYLNDMVIVDGNNFLTGDEGTTELILSGTFTTTETGAQRTLSSFRVPAEEIEASDRTRTTFAWSPRIGGLAPGNFEGSITPENNHVGGEVTYGRIIENVAIEQRETFLLGVDPSVISIGQITQITGRGFIGPSDGTTVLRLVGTFTPWEGSPDERTISLIGEYREGSRIDYPVTITDEGNFLHSVDFGAHRGVFEGYAVPVLTTDSETREGLSAELTLTLGPVLQVVWVRFLPGFSDSLELFGLGAVETEIKRRVIERMREVYCPMDALDRCINVDFRADEPVDFYEGGYAVLEIGGPDPNDLGLFGYDNTPGKDVGNLRLHDHVGGENALGALDSYGYGGVFIESLLFWSEHPPFSSRPPAAPPSDPVFDDTFDPVRDHEVVAGEWPDGATPERIAEIELAIHFLSSMVADTAAHEFGHSLGLAEPYGGPTEFHNAIPRDHCLMDSGRNRPLDERARLGGNEGASFCDNNLFYLRDVLPVD